MTGSGGEVWTAFEGPSNQLWVGVDRASGGWGVSYEGPSGTTYSAPSTVIDSSNDLWVATEGPNHKLNLAEYVYGKGWEVPAVSTAEDVYSAPSIVAAGSEIWVAFEGPSGKIIDGYVSGGRWAINYESAENLDAASASPSEVIDSSGNLWVFFEGVNHALRLVERAQVGGWGSIQALLGENTIYSVPSAVALSGGEKWVAFEGPKNEMWDGFLPTSGVWSTNYQGPEGSEYSAPSETIDSEGNLWVAAQGNNNTLDIKVRRKLPKGEWVTSYEGG